MKTRRWIRFVSMLLTAAMLMTMLPLEALAEEETAAPQQPAQAQTAPDAGAG